MNLFYIPSCFLLLIQYSYVLVRINLPLFSIVLPSNSCCFCPVGLSLLIQHFQQVLRALKLLLSPGLGSWQLEFKSLIIDIVGFLNFEFFFCYFAWVVDLWLVSQLRVYHIIDFKQHINIKFCFKCKKF